MEWAQDIMTINGTLEIQTSSDPTETPFTSILCLSCAVLRIWTRVPAVKAMATKQSPSLQHSSLHSHLELWSQYYLPRPEILG